jgi:hypothetical protein
VGLWLVAALIFIGLGCAVFVALSVEGSRLHKIVATIVVLAVPVIIWAFGRWFDAGCIEGYEDCGALDWVWAAPLIYCGVAVLGFAMLAYRRVHGTPKDRR